MKTIETFESALMAYIRAYETLTPDTIDTELLPLMAPNVYFEDPFNQVVGHLSVKNIFRHMFANTNSPKFHVVSYALNDQLAFLRWEFCFVDGGSKSHQVLGVSKITFDGDRQVLSHIDYWDTGKYVYQKVPVLGWLIRRVNSLLSANAS